MSNKGKRIKERRELLDIDPETGEIRPQIIDQTYKYPAEPKYIKLYLGVILEQLNGMPASHTDVMFQLLIHVNYANDDAPMVLYINSALKREILSKTSLRNIQTIDNVISALSARGIIRRIDRGAYQLNPYIFGKGDWRDIYELRVTSIFNRDYGHNVDIDVKYNSSNKSTPPPVTRQPIHLTDTEKMVMEMINHLDSVTLSVDVIQKKLGLTSIPLWVQLIL